MNTNKHELLFREEVYQVVGCAMEVLNTLGHGLLEKPYENALVVEFGLRGISTKQQPLCILEWTRINTNYFFKNINICVHSCSLVVPS